MVVHSKLEYERSNGPPRCDETVRNSLTIEGSGCLGTSTPIDDATRAPSFSDFV